MCHTLNGVSHKNRIKYIDFDTPGSSFKRKLKLKKNNLLYFYIKKTKFKVKMNIEECRLRTGVRSGVDRIWQGMTDVSIFFK